MARRTPRATAPARVGLNRRVPHPRRARRLQFLFAAAGAILMAADDRHHFFPDIRCQLASSSRRAVIIQSDLAVRKMRTMR
jgi:hypothetical protein